jgi:hypothetical protein
MIGMHRLIRFVAFAALAAVTVSCGSAVRTGRGASFLVIDSLQGIRGATTLGTPTSTLISDVITNVSTPAPCSTTNPCPTVFGDPGQVSMHIVMKDSGSANPTLASPINSITITRYRVAYIRADGRNTPGVDVPYGFDGAVTATVTDSPATFGFSLVRLQAKEEAPLVLLRNGLSFVTQLANVTFYGKDQAGNEVSVTGTIEINFGNFGDPA